MDSRAPSGLFAPWALLPGGWSQNVEISFARDGTFGDVRADVASSDFPRARGPVLPGMPNTHSHAFQRLLVGRTQHNAPDDDFWSWRSSMYRLVDRLNLDQLEMASTWLYSELLKGGYTSVAEFHYLHHPGGASAMDTAACMRRAARSAGIRLTLLPVLYQFGGFGEQPLGREQQRFNVNSGDYETLVRELDDPTDSCYAVGVAAHSLRAVGPRELDLIARLGADGRPVHLHISEQPAEVRACVDHFGKPPIEWLYEHAEPNNTWCLVHATQASDHELRLIAESGARVGLCPTTEHDLGDGRFPAGTFHAMGGRTTIGSDSHVSTSAGEELRLILYGERASAGRRGVMHADPASGRGTGWSTGLDAGQSDGRNDVRSDCWRDDRSAGTTLWTAAAENAAPVMGQPVGRIATGASSDGVVLDADDPLFAGLTPDQATSAYVLSGSAQQAAAVYVGGTLVVKNGRHVSEDALARDWRSVAGSLKL